MVQQRCLWLVGLLVVFSVRAYPQSCPQPRLEITNFRITNIQPTAASFTWNPLPYAFTSPPVYEIVRDEAPTTCGLVVFNPSSPVAAQTTTTSASVTHPLNQSLCYRVRVRNVETSCEIFSSPICYNFAPFTTPSLKPNLISAIATGPAQVTLTYSHPDPRTPVVAFRAGANGVFEYVDFINGCPANSTLTVTDYGPGGSAAAGGKLAPGTYHYKIAGFTETAFTYSDVKTVVVGGGSCTPPAVTPQVSSPKTTLDVGEQAVINWTTNETPDRFFLELSKNAAFSPVRETSEVPGSARSANLRFTEPGTYFLRVVASNSCGRKEGVPVITFTVQPEPARVVVTNKPNGMLQVLGSSGIDQYTLTNIGGSATSLSLSRNGNFFNQAPAQFTLAPGQSQVVVLTAAAQSEGAHSGESIVSGSGAEGLRVPVRVLAETKPNGDPIANAETPRVDVAGGAEEQPTGSITFTNTGTAPVKGILVSDVPWIVPVTEFTEFAAGGSAALNFRIDRSRRPNAAGSAIGGLSLVYMQGTTSPAFKGDPVIAGATPPAGAKSTVVSVTDTVKPPTSAGAIPPLGSGEVALFIPGIERGAPSAGTVVKSDVTLFNSGSTTELRDLKVFFTSAAGASANATFNSVSPDQNLKLADVSKSVFNTEGQVGSLQVRATNVRQLVVDARRIAESQGGTRGHTIPIFQSDRAVAPQQSLHLTGLMKDANFSTDLFVQETAGQNGTARIDFRSSNGTTVGAPRDVTLTAFGFTQIRDGVPAGAVAAIITNTSTTGANIQSYGAVFDSRTGDSWNVADWSKTYGYTMNESIVVPVAGRVRGRNNTDFRSDVTVMNTATTTGTATITFFPETGPPVQRVLSLGARESRVLNNVLDFFNVTRQVVGFIVFTPNTGANFVVSSRTYTVSSTGTLSTSVPVVPTGRAISFGQRKKLAGLEDVLVIGPSASKPGTFRTNLGILEVSGQAVKVRARLRYTGVLGAAAATGLSAAEFTLAGNQFHLLSSLTSAILKERRLSFGDLRDVQVDVEVIEGTGSVIVFTTSTDNASNDSSIRLE